MSHDRATDAGATALIALFIFTFVNAIGALWNDAHAMSYYGSAKVLEALPFHVIFLVLFWLSALPQIPVRTTFRLPLIQAVFWIWIAQGAISPDPLREMATSEFIEASIPPFCFPIGPLMRIVPAALHEHPFIHLYGLLITCITIYKVLVLEASQWLAGRWLGQGQANSTYLERIA